MDGKLYAENVQSINMNFFAHDDDNLIGNFQFYNNELAGCLVQLLVGRRLDCWMVDFEEFI